MQIDIRDTAAAEFSFLNNLGFKIRQLSQSQVRYCKGDLEIVIFRDPQSYELGLAIGFGDDKYSASEMIRLIDEKKAEKYRDPVVGTSEELLPALQKLSDVVRDYGGLEISRDSAVFLALGAQRREFAEKYSIQVRATRVRPQAEQAFSAGDYARAAMLYKEIESVLSISETKKLSIAKLRM